jgi:hypothetical protein
LFTNSYIGDWQASPFPNSYIADCQASSFALESYCTPSFATLNVPANYQPFYDPANVFWNLPEVESTGNNADHQEKSTTSFFFSIFAKTIVKYILSPNNKLYRIK